MSAWIVSDRHMDALVQLAVAGPLEQREVIPDHAWYRHSVSELTADGIGRLLIDANVASVRYRYPDCGDDLPGPLVHYWAEPYTFTGGPKLTAVAGLKAIDAYVYQSCEPPGWEASEARRLCLRLADALHGYLPGYEEAEWSL